LPPQQTVNGHASLIPFVAASVPRSRALARMTARFFYEVVSESGDDTVVSITSRDGEDIIEMTIEGNFDGDVDGSEIESEILNALIEDGDAEAGDTVEPLECIDDEDSGEHDDGDADDDSEE
jgi:hypothetical protein